MEPNGPDAAVRTEDPYMPLEGIECSITVVYPDKEWSWACGEGARFAGRTPCPDTKALESRCPDLRNAD